MLRNKRHEAFAQKVAKGVWGTAAYMELYPVRGRNVAAASATRLRKRADVARRIQQLNDAYAERCRAEVGRRIETLKAIAFANPGSVFDGDGKIRPPSEWPDSIRPAGGKVL